ncbi:MAG: PIG-L deacetylase family protein [Thermoguttaceae bacterium]
MIHSRHRTGRHASRHRHGLTLIPVDRTARRETFMHRHGTENLHHKLDPPFGRSSRRTTSKVLIVAAHPDDEILGGGATYAKRLARGDSVHAVVMCEGESVRYTSQGRNVGQQEHAKNAAKTLGFTSFRCLKMPDQRLDACSQIDLNTRLEAILDELRPAVVYTHCPGDINRDHQVTHESVMVATRPGRSFIREVFGFETPSTTGLWNTHSFTPDTFEIIDETLEKKLAAMACYETETNTFPHPRSVESLRHRAYYWGNMIQRVAAEPFMTLRRIHQ